MAALNSLVSALETSPATTSLPLLRETRAAFEKATEKLTVCYAGICILAEKDADRVAKATKSCEDVETQANNLRQRADACEMGLTAKMEDLKIEEARQSIALATAQAAAAGAGQMQQIATDPNQDVQIKIDTTFKPTRLLGTKSSP